jgi:hypothetical protein
MNVDELLRDADPARELRPPLVIDGRAGWELARQMSNELSTSSTSHRPSARRRVVVPVLIAASVVVIALLVATLVPLGSSTTPANAATALRNASHALASTGATGLVPNSYLYTEVKSGYQVTVYKPSLDGSSFDATTSATYGETEQAWADASGNGQGVLNRTPLSFSSPVAQSSFEASSEGQHFISGFQQTVNESDLSQYVPNVTSLPVDPSPLSEILSSGTDGTNPDGIPNGATAVFQRAARLLVGPDTGMSPAFASALFQVMSDQPGIKLAQIAMDHSGRTGTEASIAGSSGVSSLIFSEQTGAVLEAGFAPSPASVPADTQGSISFGRCDQDGACSAQKIDGPPLGIYIVAPLWETVIESKQVIEKGTT